MSLIADQEELAIVLNTNDKPIRLVGFIILLVMIGGFGTWSYMAPIGSSAIAPGVVSVKSHRKTVQHLEGGIVKQIDVRDGDLVSAGDVLLSLDTTQDAAYIQILRGQYITAEALNARLKSERGLAKKISFSEEFLGLEDKRVKEAAEGQKQIFMARRHSYLGELEVLRQRIKQLALQISGLKESQASNRQLARSFAEEVEDLRSLLNDGFADKRRLRELERNHTQIKSEISGLTTDIATTKMQQGETKLQILQIERKFQEDIATQLVSVNAELFSINEQLVVAEDKVRRSTILAPVRGVVLGMSAHTTGGVVMPGESILDIVPEDEELIITAKVSPVDIDQVHIGSLAEIRFSAFSSKTTPVMEGMVQTVSADSLLDEITGMQFYEARIELTAVSSQRLGKLVLIPGMPAEVLINTGERTLFEYLMQPLTDAFARSFTEE
ncbi:MAG: HlyD family type I secretion periplasmic adaptor subunit [Methyloprofundus sp.]|nr:HlyD family type I secretion periplasmic adaptor subunit [Methyloprofundus sp.]